MRIFVTTRPSVSHERVEASRRDGFIRPEEIVRLKKSRVTAQEEITEMLNTGYQIVRAIEDHYYKSRKAGDFEHIREIPLYEEAFKEWVKGVRKGLKEVFPTDLEANYFETQEVLPRLSYSRMDQRVGEIVDLFPRYLDRLRRILDTDLARYTDLPIQDRLYVEDIDSFAKVRDMNPSIVAPFLSNGFLDLSENRVQLALEQILDVSFHRIDWPGEMNDLYTANTLVNGARRATAFLLKGPGIGRKEMQIGDCGKNGDQLVRLFTTPADLYIVQYVGPISDLLIKDVEGKIAAAKTAGKRVHFLIMDGQDTARLLHAYSKL
jgi:hypothetical protein